MDQHPTFETDVTSLRDFCLFLGGGGAKRGPWAQRSTKPYDMPEGCSSVDHFSFNSSGKIFQDIFN